MNLVSILPRKTKQKGNRGGCFSCGDRPARMEHAGQFYCRYCFYEIPTVLRLEPVKQVAR